jgi:hypothetical protein
MLRPPLVLNASPVMGESFAEAGDSLQDAGAVRVPASRVSAAEIVCSSGWTSELSVADPDVYCLTRTCYRCGTREEQ